jgi:hypothetical protein
MNAVDRLLSKAAVSAPEATGSSGSHKGGQVPDRLDGAALGRLSLQVAAKVRQCAREFGFARTLILAEVRVSGATGRVTGLTLSDRFAGSPVEQCARRGTGSVKTTSFGLDSQKTSVPVVIR